MVSRDKLNQQIQTAAVAAAKLAVTHPSHFTVPPKAEKIVDAALPVIAPPLAKAVALHRELKTLSKPIRKTPDRER